MLLAEFDSPYRLQIESHRMEDYSKYWDELTRVLKKVYGIHDDPTNPTRLCYIDRKGQRQVLCTLTYPVNSSTNHDFETISTAIVRNKLEDWGIARQPGLRII